jgi:hypothetical protein
MKLLEVYNNLGEQEDKKFVEFPRYNFYVSFDDQQKKVLFSPIKTGAHSSKARTFVNMLKQKFRITNVRSSQVGAFEITVDPRENFGLVKDYITQSVDRENV